MPDRSSLVQARLRCVGNTLAAEINGQESATVTDGTYADGFINIQGNGPAGVPLDLRLTHLSVSAVSPETSAQAARPVPSQRGTVLLADSFLDPDHGWLPRGAMSPTTTLEYASGAYRMARAQDADNYAVVTLPGVYSDTKLALDVEVSRGVLEVKCRVSRDGSWYVWRVVPSNRSYMLNRSTTAPTPSTITLAQDTNVSAINALGATNHLEFGCVGDLLSVSANGVSLAAVNDAAPQTGSIVVQAGGLPGRTEAVLHNLLLEQG